MKRVGLIALVGALAAIAGCRETQHCIDGLSYQNGSCMPIDASNNPDTGADAGSDAASDGGHDAGTDAGPCATCGDGSVCSNSGDAGVDAGSMLSCVQCVNDSHCSGSATDGGFFDGGTTGADGGAAVGRMICTDFHCVFGCRDGTDCGGNVCRANHTCSRYGTYLPSDEACRPCDTDLNCPPANGYLCLPFHYQNGTFIHDGHYCLRHGATCGATTAPLANAMAASSPSIDGVAVTDTTCAPATSCEALTDTADRRTCSSVGDSCGLPGVVDGLCPLSARCTIRCTDTSVCPDITTMCSGSPAVCSP